MKKILAAVASASLIVGVVGAPAVAHTVPDTWVNSEHVTRYPMPLPRVTDLRYSSNSGYDRVVIDMKGQAPGYDVRYVSSLTYCGTGNPVTGLAAGRKFLRIQLTPAQAHTDAGSNTYSGPVNRYVGLPTVKRIVKTCDFEGYVEFGLVLDRKAGFHCKTLYGYGPTRIYCDVNH